MSELTCSTAGCDQSPVYVKAEVPVCVACAANPPGSARINQPYADRAVDRLTNLYLELFGQKGQK